MKNINGKKVDTYKKEFIGENTILTEVGTTGFCGGNTYSGSRTYLKLENVKGSDIGINILLDSDGDDKGVEIVMGGDSELQTFIDALEFAVHTLKKKRFH